MRLIKDKQTGENKDYAFVEFSSIEEAADVMKDYTLNPSQLQGKDLFIDFSKLRKIDEGKLVNGVVVNRNTNNVSKVH